MIGNIDIEFPAIYIINKFIGTCFIGASAKSHDFFVIRRDTSVFLDTSVFKPTLDALYPGGEAKSWLLVRVILKIKKLLNENENVLFTT